VFFSFLYENILQTPSQTMTLLRHFLTSAVIMTGFLSCTAFLITPQLAGTNLLISDSLCEPTDPITPTSDDDPSNDSSDSNSDDNNEGQNRSRWNTTDYKTA
jgi:hypothetical protein